MSSTSKDLKKCIVKVIVNPTREKCFSLRFSADHINLKLQIRHVAELHSLLDTLDQELPIRFHYSVQFNWSNTPNEIQNDKLFKDKIWAKFNSGMIYPKQLVEPLPPPPVLHGPVPWVIGSSLPHNEAPEPPAYHIKDIDRLVRIVAENIKTFGSAPDLTNHTEKNSIKIRNYLRSSLAIPALTTAEAIEIAKRVPPPTREL
jgi:hypothetical protein